MLMEFFLVVFLVLLISCKKDTNPISIQSEKFPIGWCSTVGIEIAFVDSCSYNFATKFLLDFDSVKILKTNFGINLYLYADSGDVNYWKDYFSEDSSFFDLSFYNQSDTLILSFMFLNEEVYLSEKDNLINHRNLFYKWKIEENKTVLIKLPEGSESEWINYFMQFDFIEYAHWIGICNDVISKLDKIYQHLTKQSIRQKTRRS